MFFTAVTSLFYSGNIFVILFSKLHNFCKTHTGRLLLTSFVSGDVGKQHKVKPNAMVTDDAVMQQCATAHCAYKIATMLTRETSELTGLDL